MFLHLEATSRTRSMRKRDSGNHENELFPWTRISFRSDDWRRRGACRCIGGAHGVCRQFWATPHRRARETTQLFKRTPTDRYALFLSLGRVSTPFEPSRRTRRVAKLKNSSVVNSSVVCTQLSHFATRARGKRIF